MPNKISIAIDGPAGAGKTATAKALALALSSLLPDGCLYIDTGALYRTTALYLQRRALPVEAAPSILGDIHIAIQPGKQVQRMFLNGEDVTPYIRTQTISKLASDVSALPPVREFLLGIQREFAEKDNVVMEGRDIGSVVLPNATVKFFLTADPEIRAKRRYTQELKKGKSGQNLNDVLVGIQQRDKNDSSRATAPLQKTEDAVLVDNSNLTLNETVSYMLEIIRMRGFARDGGE